ncbi:MAG: putative drug exporter of the superfamily [Gaiellales bacterium]|nr:putative drug exporter of the superfamily [Gaiellales bacterium]
MTRLTRLVLRHRRLVALVWLVIFVAGVATVGRTVDRLTFDFSLPGQPGHDTSMKILSLYGSATEQPPYLLVIAAPQGQTLQPGQGDAAFAAVAKAVPTARLIGHAQTGDAAFVTKDGRAEYSYAFEPLQQGFAAPAQGELEKAIAANAPAGTTGYVTGLDPLAQSTAASSGPGVLLETILGGVGALAVLVFVFASFLALIPLAIAIVSILTTFLVLLGVTYFADISFIVQFLVSLIGLGVAIDYSLLVVTRWREERGHGRSNHEAVVVAMNTAGRAVVFSGLTVAIGLLALVVIPVPFLRSIGFGGMLIPLVSVAVATTLLPAILASIGPRVDWPRVRKEATASRFWTRWGQLIVRRRLVAAGAATAILVGLAIPFLSLQIGQASSNSLATAGPAVDGLHVLDAGGVTRGALTPMVVLTSAGSQAAVAQRLRSVNGVVDAPMPTDSADTRNGTALVLAVPSQETSNADTIDVVRRTRSALDAVPGSIGVSGVGPLQLDYQAGVYGNLPYVILVIVVITFLLLARAFRSVLLPFKAVILNLLSLAATFGGLVIFWQAGHGSSQVFGIAPTGSITFWLPVMIFAFLFGLSMDYEVFILSRVREEYDATGKTDAAVVTGLGRTGRLVTSAALILFLAFISLASGPQTDIKVFATGLGFGILLDATVVRMLLVPALVSVFGEWNWYMPAWFARVLRLAPARERLAA